MPFMALSALTLAQDCPDLSGNYRVVDSGVALTDALNALRSRPADPRGIILKFSGATNGQLSIEIVHTASGYRSTQPHILSLGTDFECKSGSLVFPPIADTYRKPDGETVYEGTSSISMSAPRNGGIPVVVNFSGGKRTTLFSYDSARISIPNPGTRTTIRDTLYFQAMSDAQVEAATAPPRVESNDERDVRLLLTRVLLEGVFRDAIESKQDGVLVKFRAMVSDDVLAFEERLRSASIHYEIVGEPYWENNHYDFALLFRKTGDAKTSASRPSLMRIETDMRELAWPLANLEKVERVDDRYFATITLQPDGDVQRIIQRIKVQTGLIAQAYLVEVSAPADATHGARIKLELRLR